MSENMIQDVPWWYTARETLDSFTFVIRKAIPEMMGWSNQLVTFLSAFAAGHGYFVSGTHNKLNMQMQVSIYYLNYC